MPLQITIGGVDYTPFVDIKTISVDNNIAVTSDTAKFDLLITKQAVARPKGGQELIIENGSVREFGGVVMAPEENAVATDSMLYHCQSRDYGYWADKHLVVEDYPPDYAGNMIKSAVSTFGNVSGFTTNNVQLGPLAPYQKTDYLPLTKFVKKIADLFSYGWYLDYYRDWHFFSFETFLSPLSNNQFNADDPSATYYSELKIKEDVSQVRTRVYMKGHKVGAIYTVTDTFVGDGQQTSFPLKYEPIHDLSKMTVTVGGTTFAKKRDIVEGLPTVNTQDNTAYINFDSPQSRFNVAPASGAVINVTYRPRLREVLGVSDVEAQQIMAARDGQDGIYEYAVDDPGLSWDDQTIAQARGQLEVNKYGRPHYSGSFKSFLQGWRAGQFFYFYSKNRMDGDLDGYRMFVTKVNKTVVNHPLNGSPTFQYQVSFADSPYVF